MRPPGDAARRGRSSEGNGAAQELQQEPQAEEDERRDLDRREEDEQRQERHHARPREEEKVGAEDAGDRAGGPEVGHRGGGLEADLHGEGRRAARDVEQKVPAVTEGVLHVVPEDVEVEHVPQQVHPPAVEKHRRYGREQLPDGKGPAAEEPGGNHRVPLEKRWEILPQGNLVEKKTEVGGDQQVGDDGEAVGRDRVADGNHGMGAIKRATCVRPG